MEDNLLPLTNLCDGEEARFICIDGECGIRGRLSVLGLVSGARVKMIHNALWGPIILGLMDSRIALGRGIAKRILVSKG